MVYGAPLCSLAHPRFERHDRGGGRRVAAARHGRGGGRGQLGCYVSIMLSHLVPTYKPDIRIKASPSGKRA